MAMTHNSLKFPLYSSFLTVSVVISLRRGERAGAKKPVLVSLNMSSVKDHILLIKIIYVVMPKDNPAY
jgi:hypothetical protein